MSGSSNLDSFRDWWLVALQLLFYRVLCFNVSFMKTGCICTFKGAQRHIISVIWGVGA